MSSDSFGGACAPARQSHDPGFTFHIPEVSDVEVFVVVDDGVSVTIAQASLEREGHPVRSFGDPSEALDAMRTRPPEVLVTDLIMPGLSGVDLARLARLRYSVYLRFIRYLFGSIPGSCSRRVVVSK